MDTNKEYALSLIKTVHKFGSILIRKEKRYVQLNYIIYDIWI